MLNKYVCYLRKLKKVNDDFWFYTPRSPGTNLCVCLTHQSAPTSSLRGLCLSLYSLDQEHYIPRIIASHLAPPDVPLDVPHLLLPVCCPSQTLFLSGNNNKRRASKLHAENGEFWRKFVLCNKAGLLGSFSWGNDCKDLQRMCLRHLLSNWDVLRDRLVGIAMDIIHTAIHW